MGHDVRLNRKEIQFIMDMTEINDEELAIQKIAEMMIEERVDPLLIRDVVVKAMKTLERRK